MRDIATVVNIRDIDASASDVIYVGRVNSRRGLPASPFANRFKIGRDGTREEVIEKYRAWFYAPQQAQLRARAREELAGKKLACWCAPQACHGDVLAQFVNEESVK